MPDEPKDEVDLYIEEESTEQSDASKDDIIRKQHEKIMYLTVQMGSLSIERDVLLCEVSRLQLELEVASLKRLSRDFKRLGGGEEGHRGVQSYHPPGRSHPHVNLLHQSSSNQKLERSSSCGSPHAVVHSTPHVVHQSSGHAAAGCKTLPVPKKPPTRSGGDVLKRGRIQAGYELSQDLLDKKTEILERKYGGAEKARAAAIIIQRTFRGYTLRKRFSAIVAFARAERSRKRRIQDGADGSNSIVSDKDSDDSKNAVNEPSQTPPLRSLSLRERRQLTDRHGSLPRSQSGADKIPHHVEYFTPTGVQPCIHHSPRVVGQCRLEHHPHAYYCGPSDLFGDSYQHITHSPHCSYMQSRNPPSPYSHWIYNPDAPGVPASGMASNCSGPVHQTPPRPSSAGSSSGGSSSAGSLKKVPPEVPKRTSSISLRGTPEPQRISKSVDHGSVSSVQSSGSDSSLSVERTQSQQEAANATGDAPAPSRGSPIWKRKQPDGTKKVSSPDNLSGDISAETRKDLGAYQKLHDHVIGDNSVALFKATETVRKRQYRVGLNLFNKKPERGISYLINRGFLAHTPQAVANFLMTRKGLSKQMIGEYLGNLQSPFNMEVLHYFSLDIDLAGMPIDVALRKFQTYFRMPGEAQKIERLMEVFSKRYCSCNRDVVATLRSSDTVFILAFSIIMLNTDLHTPNLKPERRMKLEEFIKNLRGIDASGDVDRDMLVGFYERVKEYEFKAGNDHVTQVMKVQSSIVGKKTNLALPHRRLVCYCRLYEIQDILKKERVGVHQREVFLFNDLIVVTKILNKKKDSLTYSFRNSFPLCGMVVTTFSSTNYPFGITLSQRVGNTVVISFNARNEHDRTKFAEDLRESISEMDEMENLRIEQELEKQKSGRGGVRGAAPTENRDSGVSDVEVAALPIVPDECKQLPPTDSLKRSALSNSLLDMQETCEKPHQRRGSVGSLDSGMSISFSATSASTVSRDSSPQNLQNPLAGKPPKSVPHQQSFLGGIFAKRERKTSRAGQEDAASCASIALRTSDV